MKYISILATMLAWNVLMAQADLAELVSIYGAEKCAGLTAESADYLLFKNIRGAYTQEMSGVKDISSFQDALGIAPVNGNFPPLTTEALINGFPLLAYAFPTSEDIEQYYRIGDSGVLLVVYPEYLVKLLYHKEQ